MAGAIERKTSTIINTLIGSGFKLLNVTSKPSYLLLRVYRTDEFRIAQRYVLAYSGDTTVKSPAIAGLRKVAANDHAPLVIIGKAETKEPTIPILTLAQFIGQMGGSVPTFCPLSLSIQPTANSTFRAIFIFRKRLFCLGVNYIWDDKCAST